MERLKEVAPRTGAWIETWPPSTMQTRCAALGLSRGSLEEKGFLEKFAEVKLTCVAVPLKCGHSSRELSVKRMQDYHTVLGTVKPDGEPKGNAVLTYRQYLNDAFFYALLEGERAFLEEVVDGPEKKTGLRNPV